MKKLAFIDHSFHIKSTATQFLIELLRETFYVKVFWDESWEGGACIDLKDIKNEGFEILIFFQMMNYDTNLIDLLKFEQVVYIPMYDDVVPLKDYEWRPYSKYKFINFSKTLHDKLDKFGIESLYVQYFPDVSKFKQVSHDGCRGFFWQRTNYLEWNTIVKLIDKESFDSFYFHSASDPLQRKVIPSQKDKEKFNITITDWFEDKESFLSVLMNSNVFFAPRLYEGIGMAFLEAMAMGMCVVAPNNPTMNEYIDHGVTGLLYEPYSPEKLDFSATRVIGENAMNFCQEGYKEWLNQKEQVAGFIKKDIIHNLSKIDIPSKPFIDYVKPFFRSIYHLLPEWNKKIGRRIYHSFFQ